MRWLSAVAALLLVSLTIASAAIAGTYAGPMQWSAGQGAGTSFSSTWLRNEFATYGSGYDKTVTFIDNVGYGWHNTIRNTSQTTTTYAPYPGTFKGHCRANVSYFYGSCTIR